MQQYLLATSLLFSLSGCVTYQFMRVSGKDISQNEKQEFVLENDSLRLKYNFYGYNAPIRIEVQNKLKKPIYIDWKRSALIVNENAISYVPPSAPISGSVSVSSSTTFNNLNRSVTTSSSGNISGSVGLPPDIEFIPPASQVSKTLMGVTNSFHDNPEKDRFTVEKVLRNNVSYTGRVWRAAFDEKDSPLRFASYLTIYVDGSTETPVVLQHNFYISEIIKSNIGPHGYRFMNDEQGDRFYVSQSNQYTKSHGYGVVLGTPVLNIPVENAGGGIK